MLVLQSRVACSEPMCRSFTTFVCSCETMSSPFRLYKREPCVVLTLDGAACFLAHHEATPTKGRKRDQRMGERYFDHIAEELVRQTQRMDKLEAENRELRRQLDHLRSGEGIAIAIGGTRFALQDSS